MAEGDGNRVEPRTVLVGRGMGITPERIAEIEERARQVEKLNRPKPAEPFSAVMAKRSRETPEPEPSAKEQKTQALPKKGPRPALLHPAQREVFGRDEETSPVVLKG